MAPSKLLIATEACNCVGNVIFGWQNLAAWWTRAEKLALDILEDLLHWAVGWIDWNLLVDTSGGPNHLKRLLHTLEAAVPNQQTEVTDLFLELAGQMRQRGLVALFSDLFLPEKDLRETLQRFRYRGPRC